MRNRKPKGDTKFVLDPEDVAEPSGWRPRPAPRTVAEAGTFCFFLFFLRIVKNSIQIMSASHLKRLAIAIHQ